MDRFIKFFLPVFMLMACAFPVWADAFTTITVQTVSADATDYQIRYSIVPLEDAPQPEESIVDTFYDQKAVINIDLPSTGTFEYEITPRIVSGDVHFVDGDEVRIARIIRYGDNSQGIKAYRAGDPWTMTDLVWHVAKNEQQVLPDHENQNQSPSVPGATVQPKPDTSPSGSAPNKNPTGNSSTHTSSSTDLYIWLGIFVLALIILVVVLVLKKKKKTE